MTTSLACRFAVRIMCFCWTGTRSGGSSTPRSPRATITPSTTSRIASRFSRASGFSSLAISSGGRLPLQIRSIASCTLWISPAVRTNETATASTSCEIPNARSSSSFSVNPGMRRRTPGRLMPLCEERVPPTITFADNELGSSTETTSSVRRPSSSRSRSEVCTESNSCRKSTGIFFSLFAPGEVPVAYSVTSSPSASWTGPGSPPTRIFGPCRS